MTTFLTDALKKQPFDFSTIDIDQVALEAYEPDNPRLVTLLYQTGYLTIRSFRQQGGVRRFDLCFPNLEVENSFLTSLASVYAGIDADRSTNCQFAAGDALVAGDAEKFVKVLPAEEALAQIDERNYAEKYDFAGKAVKKLGISFSDDPMAIERWRDRMADLLEAK